MQRVLRRPFSFRTLVFLQTDRLTQGLVIAVEPIIATRAVRPVTGDDGWTIRTHNGALAAHYEHTVVVTKGEPILLTA